jgi:hypothetical protein
LTQSFSSYLFCLCVCTSLFYMPTRNVFFYIANKRINQKGFLQSLSEHWAIDHFARTAWAPLKNMSFASTFVAVLPFNLTDEYFELLSLAHRITLPVYGVRLLLEELFSSASLSIKSWRCVYNGEKKEAFLKAHVFLDDKLLFNRSPRSKVLPRRLFIVVLTDQQQGIEAHFKILTWIEAMIPSCQQA